MLLFTQSPDGFVYTAGQNMHGQLSSDTVDRPTFTKVQGVPNAKAMAVGWYHCILLTEDGEVTILIWRYPAVGDNKVQFVNFPVGIFLIC